MELLADVSAVRQFLAYLDHLGLDERELQIGFMDGKIRTSTAPMQVSALLIIDLMDAAARKLSDPRLGLHFAQWLNPRGFGALSLLSEHCSSLAELGKFIRDYIHLENGAVIYDLEYENPEVANTFNVLPILRSRARPFLESIMAVTVRYFRSMLGEAWVPLRIEFSGPKSSPVMEYRRFFGCGLQFNSERNAIIVRRDEFERIAAKGNPETRSFIERHLAIQSLHWTAKIDEQVSHLIAATLSGSAPSLPQIATMLATSPRTLQRKLSKCGTDFETLLKSVRIEIVNGHLAREPRAQLARIAYDLGFSEPSAASRFITSEFGRSFRKAPAQTQDHRRDNK